MAVDSTHHRRPPLWLLLLVCFTTTASHIKLNVPRVRLPYFDSLPVNYTLTVGEGTRGCFKWTTTRPSIVSIHPLPEECPILAVISTLPGGHSFPTHTIVYAEELLTGETVRCDVVVDRISSLAIVTETRELHLEEAPSRFTLRAYGANNNEFTTLEGVPFKWWLDGSSQPDPILRFIPFSESLYESPPSIPELESRHLQGSHVLLEGLKTGAGKVMAKLVHGYKDLEPATVQIVVIANLVLEPREIVVGVGAVFPLKLMQLKQGRFVDIPLPSPLYNLQLTNASVLALAKSSSVTALKHGDSSIILNDSNGLLLQDEERPKSLVYVRDPKYVSITALPWKSNSLQVGVEYELQVEVLDEEGRAFYIGKHLHLKTAIDPAYFKISESSENGTHHVITPLRVGRTEVSSVLEGMRDKNGAMQKLSGGPRAKVELSIYNPIELKPDVVVVGCEEGGRRRGRDEVQLRATGGDGLYTHTSSNHSVFTIQAGLLRSGPQCGHSLITVSMASNGNIKGTVVAHHLPVSRMEVEPHAEGEVGSLIQVPVVLYAKLPDGRELPLTTCHSLQFKVEMDNSDFVYEGVKNADSPACTSLQVIGSVLGSTRLTLTYGALKETVAVSTFNPLRVLQPSNGVAVLALGSSRQVVFAGGPASPVHDLQLENGTVAGYSEIGSTAYYVYELKCNKIGESKVTLRVGEANRRSASLQLHCPEPATLTFQVDRDTHCPAVVRIPVLSDENTLLSVQVRDSKGRLFDNITSLSIEWESSNPLLSFKHEDYVSTIGMEHDGYTLPGKNLQTLIPKGEQGLAVVQAKVVGYQSGLAKLSARPEHSLELSLVSGVVLDPDHVTIFNHPSYTATIHLRGGSGFFSLNSTAGTPPITKQVYYEGNRTLLTTPLQEGEGIVRVEDVCLGKRSANLRVVVTGLGTLQLSTLDKIQLGSSTLATINILGSGGDLPDLHLIEIRAEYNRDLLQIERTDDPDAVQFRISGRALGTSSVQFKSDTTTGGGIERSVSKQVQVFPPLRVNPENLKLLTGAVYQYTGDGGPGGSDVSVQFSIGNNLLATISPTTGLLHSSTNIIGDTKVHAAALEKSNSHVHSEASANLETVQFKSIAIHAPTTRILQGRQMPVWVTESGSRLDPDSLLGPQSPLISCKWESSNADVGSLRGFWNYSRSSTQLRTAFTALKPGHVTLKLACTHNSLQYNDEVEIEVLEELQSKSILLSPNTEYRLETRPGLKYSIESSYEASCVGAGCSQQRIITISNGLVKSYEKYGVATVLLYLKRSGTVEQVGGVVVEVRPVRYLMVGAALPVYHEGKLPRGVKLETTTTFHDDLGRAYDATGLAVGVRPSRFDIVGPSGAKLELSGEGASAVKYAVEGTELRDFVLLEIEESIHPHVVQASPGQIICFTCPVLSLEKRPGLWRSYENLVVNGESGVGVAQRAGLARVEYSVDGVPVSAVEVLVVGGPVNVTLTTGPSQVTNGDLSASFRYQLSTGGGSGVMQGDCSSRAIDTEDLPFVCSVRYDSATATAPPFRARPAFSKGAYECVLAPTDNKMTEAGGVVAGALLLAVKFKESVCGANCLEATKQLEFHPALQIQSSEILITNGQASLVLTGLAGVLNQVVIIPSSPQIQLGRAHTTQQLQQGAALETRTVLLKLLDGAAAAEELTLQINSPLTRQRVIVPLRHGTAPQFRTAVEGPASGFWALLEFTRAAWTQLLFSILVVLVTLVFIHLASRYVLTASAPGNAETESVFLSSPMTVGHQPLGLRERLSYSPQKNGNSGDTGYGSSAHQQHRLFSTTPQLQQRGDGGSPTAAAGLYSARRSYEKKSPAAPWEK